MNELPEEARRGLSAELQKFYLRIDGRRVLRELFSSDPSVMNRELDLLLRQLRERNVALLPNSLEQLEAEAQRRGEPPRRRWWQRLFALPRADA